MLSDNSHNELKLLHRIALGDEKAFKQFYDASSGALYQAVHKYIPDDDVCKDLIQQMYITLWERRTTLPGIGNFQEYLFKIAFNGVRKYFRTLQRQAQLNKNFFEQVDEHNPGPDALLQLNHYQRLWDDAVQALPEQQRQVYTMIELSGHKIDEVTEKLGISKDTVKKHLALARKAVRETVRKDIGEGSVNPSEWLHLTILCTCLNLFSN